MSSLVLLKMHTDTVTLINDGQDTLTLITLAE